MNEEGYEVYYKNLKARASNFMHNFAITLAWANLIARRTQHDGEKLPETMLKWSLSDYV